MRFCRFGEGRIGLVEGSGVRDVTEALDALPDGPGGLEMMLRALALRSAGPFGPPILVNGFEDSPIPPKQSIREIRINDNPFSAEYPQLGLGRVEILTKPGTDKPHGDLFFVFGDAAVYSAEELTELGFEPFTFLGGDAAGWKMAICERDLAIYGALFIAGLVFARRRAIKPLGFVAYAVLILPMAIDGFTQTFGWRESTWELRVITGALFGAASAWLLLPRFAAMAARERYAPDAACTPQPSHG